MGLVLLLIVHLTLFSTPSTTKAKPTNAFSVDIFHRDSSSLPFYNSSLNRTEAFLSDLMDSISRSNSLLHPDYYDSPIVHPSPSNYLMRMSIGTPPVEQFLTIDTGSTLLWIQCEPCDSCYPQPSPMFDQTKSSSHRKFTCNARGCELLSTAYCYQSSECWYWNSYADGTFSKGGLGSDMISFGTDGSSGNSVTFLDVAFGCGHNNSWRPPQKTYYATGIVGLGTSPLSLVSQLSPQIGGIFSVCLPPLYSDPPGKLTFGSVSSESGTDIISTPMVLKGNSLYYVTLDAISVNDLKEPANSPTGGNMIVDSGTLLTMLEFGLYYRVQDKFIASMPSWAIKSTFPPFRMCYSNLTGVDMPVITFHFAGGDLPLDENNYLFTFPDTGLACVAIIPQGGSTSLLGIISQVDYKVEYDLYHKTISFGPTVCSEE